MHLESRAKLEEAIAQARLPELPTGELKWTKVSTAKLPAYKRVVDVHFDGIAGVSPLHFHSLVVDTSRLNDALHNAGSREIGFNKEVYQLAMKFGRNYSDRLFHLYADQRTTSGLTDDVRLILNRGIAKKGDKRDWPYRRLHFRDSKTTPLLQLVDVLLGALMFRINGHDKSTDASPSKCELSAHVLKRAGIKGLDRDNFDPKCSVWHRQLK